MSEQEKDATVDTSAVIADAVADEARRLLEGIAVFPGDKWPTAWVAERALLRDVEAVRHVEESPWAGGTLAASKLVAAAPRLLRCLLAKVQAQEQTLAEAQAREVEMRNILSWLHGQKAIVQCGDASCACRDGAPTARMCLEVGQSLLTPAEPKA